MHMKFARIRLVPLSLYQMTRRIWKGVSNTNFSSEPTLQCIFCLDFESEQLLSGIATKNGVLFGNSHEEAGPRSLQFFFDYSGFFFFF